jgi:hypothetical protein
MIKFWVCKFDFGFADGDYSRAVLLPLIGLYEGEIDESGEFGVFAGRRDGRWRWVHLASGICSRRTYKTKGGCKTSLVRIKDDVLYGRGGIYRDRRGERRRSAFRAMVESRDPSYFERLGIKDDNRRSNDGNDYWWHKI